MNDELRNILFDNDKLISNRTRESYMKNNFPFLYEKINAKYPDYNWMSRLYIFLYEIDKPCCKTCGNPVMLISFNKGFKNYCSKGCISRDTEIKRKKEETSLKKYGVTNPNKSRVVREKTEKEIMIERGFFRIYDCGNLKYVWSIKQ